MPVSYVGEPGEGPRRLWAAVADLERRLNPGAVVTIQLVGEEDELAPLVNGLPAALVDDERLDAAA